MSAYHTATHIQHGPSGYTPVFRGHYPHPAGSSVALPLSPVPGYSRVVYYSGGATWPSMMPEPGQASPRLEYKTLLPSPVPPPAPSPTPSSTSTSTASLTSESAASSVLPSPTFAAVAPINVPQQQQQRQEQDFQGQACAGCAACQAQRAAAAAAAPAPVPAPAPAPVMLMAATTPVPLGIGAAGFVSFLPSPTGEVRVLKVSAQSNPKTVAGSLAHNTRAGASPALLATGTPSVNQAIKALAIARGYLRETDHVDFVCSASLRDDERPAVSFGLHKTALVGAPEPGAIELRVASTSESHVVAGSIAKKLRAGNRIFLVAIGATSVVQTVKAIVVARRYLERDRIDITFQPEFIKVDAGDGQRSALKLSIFAHHFRS